MSDTIPADTAPAPDDGVEIDNSIPVETDANAKHSLEQAIEKAEKSAKKKADKPAKEAEAEEKPRDGGEEDSKKSRDQEVDDTLKDAEKRAAGDKPKAAHEEPPKRFSDDAKAEWANAPEPVKHEVHRAMREMESGIDKYRESANRYKSVERFDQLAKQNGTTLDKALVQYTALEKSLRSNDPHQKLAGLMDVAKAAGSDLFGLADNLANMSPNQRQALIQQHNQKQTQQQMQQMQSALAQMHQTHQHQLRQTQTLGDVRLFRSQHKDFDDHVEGMERAIRDGGARTVEQAYEMAKKREDDEKSGTKSISGAPASGSDPSVKPKRKKGGKSKSSIDDSLDRAFQKMGNR